MKKIFKSRDILDLLIAMDQAINPEKYLSSKDMITEDFTDLAQSKAKQLDIEEEFLKAKKKYSELSQETIYDYDKKSFFKDLK